MLQDALIAARTASKGYSLALSLAELSTCPVNTENEGLQSGWETPSRIDELVAEEVAVAAKLGLAKPEHMSLVGLFGGMAQTKRNYE